MIKCKSLRTTGFQRAGNGASPAPAQKDIPFGVCAVKSSRMRFVPVIGHKRKRALPFLKLGGTTKFSSYALQGRFLITRSLLWIKSRKFGSCAWQN